MGIGYLSSVSARFTGFTGFTGFAGFAGFAGLMCGSMRVW